MLTIVPGSIPDAPRRIGLPEEKDEIWMGRRAESKCIYNICDPLLDFMYPSDTYADAQLSS